MHWILLGLFGIFSAASLVSHYWGGQFYYHDLGLINGFLANTAHGRGFFWVTETQVSHLSIHFTPSLFFLVPLYWFFESPTILLWMNWFAVMGGLVFFLLIS